MVRSKRTVVLCSLITFAVIVAGCSIGSPFVSDELSSPAVEPVNRDEVIQRLFFIGDAGNPSKDRREPVLAALTHQASELPDRSLILFLGDNIYPVGMPEESDDGRSEAERKLNEQVSVVEQSGARAIFIPGNHDWLKGWEGIKRQAEFLNSKNNPRVQLLPRRGCPGPEVLDLGDRVRLVILDTQWWLQSGPKPEHPTSDCGPDSKVEVIDSLGRALRLADERYVLVVGHHPLDSHGRHGGFFDWREHVFPLLALKRWLWIPLPVIGSLYPLARKVGITNQDLSSSAYTDMKVRIEGALSERPPLAYVAAHEHVLEILQGSRRYPIVISGSGVSKRRSTLTVGSNTLFAHMHPGFVRIDFLRDDRVRLGVIEPVDDHGRSEEVFSMWLVSGE